jgi:hypothetical protein
VHPARLLWLGALLFSAAAHAGNDDESFVGNQAAMASGAVSASVADASATWYNPAGLASVEQTHVDVSGTAYTLRLYSAPDLLRSRSGEGSRLTVSEFVSIPAQLAYARVLGRGWTLGLGYFVPQSSKLLLRRSLRVPTADGDSAWQLALGVTRVAHSFGAALGLKLTQRVRLGFGLIGTYEEETFASSVIASTRAAGAPVAFHSRSSLGDSARFGLEPSVGFQFELSKLLTLSLAARGARGLLFQSRDESAADGSALVRGESDVSQLESRQRGAGPHLLRAGRFTAGVACRCLPRAWFSLEADVQPALHSQHTGVERRAVWNARLGGIYTLTEVVALGAGLFTDRASEPASDEAINGSGHFYGGTLGVELRDRHRLAAGESSEGLMLATTLALRYAYSSGSVNGLVVDPADLEAISTAKRPLIAHETSLYVGGRVSF